MHNNTRRCSKSIMLVRTRIVLFLMGCMNSARCMRAAVLMLRGNLPAGIRILRSIGPVDFIMQRNSKQVDFAMSMILSLLFYIYYGMASGEADIDFIHECYILILIFTMAMEYRKLFSPRTGYSRYPSTNTIQSISSLEREITMKSVLAPENITVSTSPCAMASMTLHTYTSSKRS